MLTQSSEELQKLQGELEEVDQAPEQRPSTSWQDYA